MAKKHCYVTDEDGKPCMNAVTHSRQTLAAEVYMCRKHARQWSGQFKTESPPRLMGKARPGMRAIVVKRS